MPNEPTPSLPLRGAFLAAVAVWLGGLTFYAGVVVPVASAELGSHRAAGFITRIVTLWLNGLGIAALAVLGAHARRLRPRGRARSVALATLGVMVVCQAALFALHPMLDGFLDPTARSVAEPDTFYLWHRAYLLTSLGLWGAGVVHSGAVLRVWRAGDGA